MESTGYVIPIADIAVAVLLLLGMIGGIRRGFSGEIIRILTIILAIFVGWKGAGAGAIWLSERTDWLVEDLKPYAFFGLILASYIVLAIARLALRLLIDFSFRGKLEIIGGAATGLFRAGIFSAVLLLAASLLDYPPVTAAIQDSTSGQLVIKHVRPLYNEIAARHPDLKLPPIEGDDANQPASPGQSQVQGLDTPAYEQYLGPLIDDEEE